MTYHLYRQHFCNIQMIDYYILLLLFLIFHTTRYKYDMVYTYDSKSVESARALP